MADAPVRLRLTVEDVVHGARLFALNGLRRPRTQISLGLIWLSALVLLALIISGGNPTPEGLMAQAPLILLCSLLPFALVVCLNLVMTPIMARRAYQQQRSLQVEMAIDWSDKGLAIDSEYGNFTIPWDHFFSWAENDKVILLFESKRLYRILPKRSFSADQLMALHNHFASIRR